MPAMMREDERSPFFRLRAEVDRLFDDFFRPPVTSGGWGSAVWPSIEVSDTDNEVRVTAELPGMSEKDVELAVQDGMLAICGDKKSESDDGDRGWSERYYGRFERRIALPDGADEAKSEASFRDGVLTVRMPKSQQAARGRKIPINAGTRH